MVEADILIKQGYRLTKPRLKVLGVLKQKSQPIAVLSIHRKLTGQGIDLVSVYRSLELFVKLGFVFVENYGKEKRYYLAKSPHHHIRCRKCHKTECLPCHHDFAKVNGFTKVNHQLVLTGLCQTCS